MSRGPLTSELLDVHYVIRNTFVEVIDREVCTARRRADSAEPLLKAYAEEDSTASRLATPDFNTRGAFDRQDWDACSDASDCSHATADWAGWTEPTEIAKRTIPTQDSQPARLASAADLLNRRAKKTSDAPTHSATLEPTCADEATPITLSAKPVKVCAEQAPPMEAPVVAATPVQASPETPATSPQVTLRERAAPQSPGPLTRELLGVHYVVKNTFVEVVDQDACTARRRADSAEPRLNSVKAYVEEDSIASRLATPDFNTRGAFDRQDWDACSDASGCSFATADWAGWTEPARIVTRNIPTQDSQPARLTSAADLLNRRAKKTSYAPTRIATLEPTCADEATPITLSAKPVKVRAKPMKPAVTAKPKPSAVRAKGKPKAAAAPAVAPVAQGGTSSPPWAGSPFGTGAAHSSQGAGVTVMVHNVPCRRPAKFLFDKFAELGFPQGCMDFVYLPMRESGGRQVGTGYMFVNVVTPQLAAAFCAAVDAAEITDPATTSAAPKCVFCSLADTQGVDANLAMFLQSKGQGLRNAVWLRHGSQWLPVLR